MEDITLYILLSQPFHTQSNRLYIRLYASYALHELSIAIKSKMDPETQANIVSTHKHLIASNTSSQLNIKSGTSTVDDSGPPSPSSGVVKNFAEVAPGIYRSSFPYPANLVHLRSLGLKTVL